MDKFRIYLKTIALNGSIVLATAVVATNSSSCACQNNSGSCILTKALMDVGSWKASPVQIRDYSDVNGIVLDLQKEGYSPIEQYTKIYTTTPGIKVIAVPLASKLHPHITKVNDTLIMNTVVVLKMFTPKHYIRIPDTKKAIVIGYVSHPAILYNMTLTIKNNTNEGTLTLVKSIYKNGKIVFLNRAKVKFDRKTHRILSVTTSGEKIQPQGFWHHIACELACEALLAGGVAACCSVVPELCAACMTLVDTSDLAVCYAACLRLGD
ncbi:hypothetical protein [Thermococcus sp.]|uniref:hypothetical protein n=1 Tax=Thermococcus sp. TaxID=35749 RepID=UPI0025CB926D|nr:hypothetical protein [Thermococcus sp.]